MEDLTVDEIIDVLACKLKLSIVAVDKFKEAIEPFKQ